MPQREHFKRSTRSLLSREQKSEIVDAVNRASDRLLRLDFRVGSLKQRLANFDRLIMLGKGSIQSRSVYRGERQLEIWQHAWTIAEETGSSVIDVHASLMRLMTAYVSEDM